MKSHELKHRTDDSGRLVFAIEHIVSTGPRTETGEIYIGNKKDVTVDAEEAEDSPEPVIDGLVRQKWRLISAVEAWPTTDFFYPQLVDYGHDEGKALAASVAMINSSKPDLMWNHSSDVKDVVGFIDSASWENSADIPPGINGNLVVDPSYDPRAAKGLQMGLLRSGSIGVMAEMRRSHEKMHIDKFVSSQGEIVEGEKVRWLLERITAVRHMAMVPCGAGADQNAGRRADSMAAKHTTREGKEMNDDRMLEAWGAVCKAARLEVALGAGNDLPHDVVDKVVARLQSGWANSELYNSLVQEVLAVGALISGEVLSVEDVMRRLPEAIANAKHGKDYLEFQRAEAVKWFDAAKVNPEEAEMPAHTLKLRKRIAESQDLDFVLEQLEEYKDRAETRFAVNRSSIAEEIPKVDAPKAFTGDPDIASSAKRMFAGGK